MNEQPTYYSITPASVRYDFSITANAKLLYGEITCLSDKHGYCFATNEYFSELYRKDDKTISRWISSLKKAGHISIEYIKRGAQVQERRIFLASRVTISSPKGQKSHSAGDEKITRTGDEKRTDIITRDNNTSKDIDVPTKNEQEKDCANALVASKVKYPGLHQRTIEWFDKAYLTVHRKKMAWTPKETKSVKNIIDTASLYNDDPTDEIGFKLSLFYEKFKNPDKWYAEKTCTPSFFLSQWNQLQVEREPVSKAEIRSNKMADKISEICRRKNDGGAA